MIYDYNPVLNKYFNDNWNATPIQYEGIRFDEPIDKTWISIQLHATDNEEQTFGRSVNKEQGLLKVFSYSDSATLSYVLASQVADFISENLIDAGFFVDVGKADGNGAVPLENGVYETLTNFRVLYVNAK